MDVPQMYACPYCAQSFNLGITLRDHLKSAHQIPNTPCKCCFSCEHCYKTFDRKENLKRHENLVHLKLKPFSCLECTKSFGEKNGLKTHVEGVHSKNNFPCPQCNQPFAHRHNVTRHIKLVHSDEKLFICQYCEKPFKVNHSLKRHEKDFHHNRVGLNKKSAPKPKHGMFLEW